MRSDGILEADMEDDDEYAFVRRYKMTNNEETTIILGNAEMKMEEEKKIITFT